MSTNRLLRVLYLDLGYSREQYGLHPTRYGGGGVVARYLKEEPDIDFHVFALREAFDNVGPSERHDRCHVLTPEAAAFLRNGGALDRVFSMDSFPYDMVLHGHTCVTINRGSFTGSIIHWSGFDGSAGHPHNDYILLYNDGFKPLWDQRAKYVRIGKPVPAVYRPHPKAPYVFQCTRHDDHMNSIETARQCLRYGIQGYFAGPIHNGYGLMEHIDGVTTHYLGEVDEATKLGYCRHARLFALPHVWDGMPFNQSAVEAQGQGTPLWTSRRGAFMGHYLKPWALGAAEGANGFDTETYTLKQAFAGADLVKGEACWAAARQYDVSVMCRTFKQAFAEIMSEWRARGA